MDLERLFLFNQFNLGNWVKIKSLTWPSLVFGNYLKRRCKNKTVLSIFGRRKMNLFKFLIIL